MMNALAQLSASIFCNVYFSLFNSVVLAGAQNEMSYMREWDDFRYIYQLATRVMACRSFYSGYIIEKSELCHFECSS